MEESRGGSHNSEAKPVNGKLLSPRLLRAKKTNEATMTLRKPQGEATAGSHMGRYVQLRELPEA